MEGDTTERSFFNLPLIEHIQYVRRLCSELPGSSYEFSVLRHAYTINLSIPRDLKGNKISIYQMLKDCMNVRVINADRAEFWGPKSSTEVADLLKNSTWLAMPQTLVFHFTHDEADMNIQHGAQIKLPMAINVSPYVKWGPPGAEVECPNPSHVRYLLVAVDAFYPEAIFTRKAFEADSPWYRYDNKLESATPTPLATPPKDRLPHLLVWVREDVATSASSIPQSIPFVPAQLSKERPDTKEQPDTKKQLAPATTSASDSSPPEDFSGTSESTTETQFTPPSTPLSGSSTLRTPLATPDRVLDMQPVNEGQLGTETTPTPVPSTADKRPDTPETTASDAEIGFKAIIAGIQAGSVSAVVDMRSFIHWQKNISALEREREIFTAYANRTENLGKKIASRIARIDAETQDSIEILENLVLKDALAPETQKH